MKRLWPGCRLALWLLLAHLAITTSAEEVFRLGEEGLPPSVKTKGQNEPAAAEQAVDGAKVLNSTEAKVDTAELQRAVHEEIETKKKGNILWFSKMKMSSGSGSGSGSAPPLAAFPEPSPARDRHLFQRGSGSGKLIAMPKRYPAQCRLDGYEREFLPVMGCTCKKGQGCKVMSANQTQFACETEYRSCFGESRAMCHAVAQTQPKKANVCHSTCATCSPGQGSSSKASPEACRSCGSSRAWMPSAGTRNWQDCVIGQQQGACTEYPHPSRQCRTSCSPSSLTMAYKPRVMRVANKITPIDVPVLACAKACSQGYTMQLDGTPAAAAATAVHIQRMVATIFCTTYKLVTCKLVSRKTGSSTDLGSSAGKHVMDAAGKSKGKRPKKPQNIWQTQWGPKPSSPPQYLCNTRKHALFVGFQAHSNEEQPFEAHKTFYMSNSTTAQTIVKKWQLKSPIMTAAPMNNPLEAKLFSMIMSKSDEMCLKHTLLN